MLTLLMSLACSGSAQVAVEAPAEADAAVPVVPSQLGLVSLNGDPLPDLDNTPILYVNVASKCGYTPQYEGLQALYEEFHPQGLQIVGVPCNQFGKQESGSAEEIATFCSLNYGVTFPLLEKQDVNGSDRSALYAALVDSPVGGGQDIKWNFEKFVVDAQGNVVSRFGSKVTPESDELRAAVAGVLTPSE